VEQKNRVGGEMMLGESYIKVTKKGVKMCFQKQLQLKWQL